jgi:nucleoid DNA-binding protein
MGKVRWALASLLCVLAVGADGQTIIGGGAKKVPATFRDGVVVASKEKEATVDRVLKAFGPAVTEQLLAGRTVELPGLGVLRVVRIAAYKDLDGGRPITVPAKNYVEFVPTAEMDRVANLPGTVPARTVTGYEFKAIGDRQPSGKVDGIKTVRTRKGGER